MRGAVYYDAFNLYHAIDDLGSDYLKWCDLRRLGELMARGKAKSIDRVVFCSAFRPGDHGKRRRHEALVAALRLVDVEVRLGHFIDEPADCRSCGHRWRQPREKESDINLALALIEDAYADRFDVAFLVTADTDQAATASMFRRVFPEKRIVNVVPPGRTPSKHLADLCHDRVKLVARHIDESVFPALVTREGSMSVHRPPEYDPPQGWVHPDERPRGRVPPRPGPGAIALGA